MKILVTSDFHGNYNHAKTMKHAVELCKPDILIHAGDYCPTRLIYINPEDAIDFLEDNLFTYFKELDVPYKFSTSGNTDLLLVTEHFQNKYQDPKVVRHTQDDCFDFPDFKLILLSTVPTTSHCLKDCEAEESFNPLTEDPKNSYVFSKAEKQSSGESSSVVASDGLEYSSSYFQVYNEFNSVPEQYRNKLKFTIFERLMKLKDATQKPIVVVSHAPCYQTKSDQMTKHGRKIHVGSRDVREFCLSQNVLAVVSGHIHQSVTESKTHKSEIEEGSGKFSYSTGNSGVDFGICEKCNYVLLDTEHPDQGEYIQIDVEPGYPHIRLDRKFKQ